MRRRQLFRGVLLALLGLTVSWGLGELLARSFHLVDRLNGFPRRLYVASDDSEIPYRLRPGLRDVARGVPVRVNAFGMRGPDVTATPTAGTRRVLALGDSVTFGYRMREEEIFPSLLEKRLSETTDQPWEVLNAGVEGYNTRTELAVLRETGFALDPDIVVLAVNLNDYDLTPVLGSMGILTLDHEERISSWSLANLSEFYLLMKWLVSTRGRVWAGETPPAPDPDTPTPEFNDFDRYVSALRKRYWATPDDRRMDEMVAALRAIREETAARGIRLLVVILPDGDQVGVAEPDLAPQQRMATICAEEELDCLDLLPAFEEEASRPLFLDIMHPNGHGHRIIANEVAARLGAP